MSLPHGWDKISTDVVKLNNTFFVVCKTPLSECTYPTTNFTEKDLAKEIKKLDVGLVIDLTMSNKYYSRKRLEHLTSVIVRKLKTKGHVVPPRRFCRYFCFVVNVFRKYNPTKNVLIHCTHGINRTGFLICYYLCQHTKVHPNDAMNAFFTQRGEFHQIYQHALRDMFSVQD